MHIVHGCHWTRSVQRHVQRFEQGRESLVSKFEHFINVSAISSLPISAKYRLILITKNVTHVLKAVPKLDNSESGQMVSEKVKLTYFDAYLSQTM